MDECKPILNTGLRGFTVATTRISDVDGKAGKLIYACSAELELNPPREHISLNGKGSWTNFSLDVLAPVATDIVIKEGGC